MTLSFPPHAVLCFVIIYTNTTLGLTALVLGSEFDKSNIISLLRHVENVFPLMEFGILINHTLSRQQSCMRQNM
jgi:hypothetical protein